MNFFRSGSALVLCALLASPPAAARDLDQAPQAGQATVRITGVVRDEVNAITLPGVPVEIVDTKQVVYTDIDGRYLVDVVPGSHTLQVSMDGYQTKTVSVQVTATVGRSMLVNVTMAMNRFAETVTVTAQAVDAPTSSAEAQLIERKQAPVITDNMGAQDMKANGDSDAAAARSIRCSRRPSGRRSGSGARTRAARTASSAPSGRTRCGTSC
jgi:hypothetical protein